MPTDSDIGLLRAEYGIDAEDVGAPKKWGEGIVWEELHHKTRYPIDGVTLRDTLFVL